MAQSPLSHQIRQLERDVGAELINRGHHVVGLTDAGETFLEAARTILADVDEAVHLARRASRGEVGTLSVGYVNEVIADPLPLSLRTFKDQYRDAELSVQEGTTGYLLDGSRAAPRRRNGLPGRQLQPEGGPGDKSPHRSASPCGRRRRSGPRPHVGHLYLSGAGGGLRPSQRAHPDHNRRNGLTAQQPFGHPARVPGDHP